MLTVIARGDAQGALCPLRTLTVADFDGGRYWFAGPDDAWCDQMAAQKEVAAKRYGCLLREVDARANEEMEAAAARQASR